MWIELHDSSRDHPKIIKLSRQLKIPKVHALGHMCSLWTWTLTMAPDGDLSSFDQEDIEIGAQWEGECGAFISAARRCRLLDDGESGLLIHDWELFASHLKARKRKRDERERKRLLDVIKEEKAPCHVTSRDVTGQGRNSGHVTQTDQTEPTRPDRHNTAPSASRAPVPAEVAGLMPLLGGKEHSITKADVLDWVNSYPAVDVPQQLRNMRQWLLSNPTKQKTHRGIRRFVTNWLAREQDRGGTKPQRGNGGKPQRSAFESVTEAAMAWATEGDQNDQQSGIHGDDDSVAGLLPERGT